MASPDAPPRPRRSQPAGPAPRPGRRVAPTSTTALEPVSSERDRLGTRPREIVDVQHAARTGEPGRPDLGQVRRGNRHGVACAGRARGRRMAPHLRSSIAWIRLKSGHVRPRSEDGTPSPGFDRLDATGVGGWPTEVGGWHPIPGVRSPAEHGCAGGPEGAVTRRLATDRGRCRRRTREDQSAHSSGGRVGAGGRAPNERTAAPRARRLRKPVSSEATGWGPDPAHRRLRHWFLPLAGAGGRRRRIRPFIPSLSPDAGWTPSRGPEVRRRPPSARRNTGPEVPRPGADLLRPANTGYPTERQSSRGRSAGMGLRRAGWAPTDAEPAGTHLRHG
jgi:hypothetical protein